MSIVQSLFPFSCHAALSFLPNIALTLQNSIFSPHISTLQIVSKIDFNCSHLNSNKDMLDAKFCRQIGLRNLMNVLTYIPPLLSCSFQNAFLLYNQIKLHSPPCAWRIQSQPFSHSHGCLTNKLNSNKLKSMIFLLIKILSISKISLKTNLHLHSSWFIFVICIWQFVSSL